MTQILKEGGKTIIKTGQRIDTMNAGQFEKDIDPALQEQGLDLEMDWSIDIPADEYMEELKSLVEKQGLTAQIGG